jgi:hypothetical protein
MQRYRHQEFIRFLNAIDADIPAGKIVRVIVDNDATQTVRAWLGRHPSFVFHFTPTSASWLNAVEGFFAKLTRGRLNAACFDRSPTSRSPSTAFCARPTAIPGPSSGPATSDKIMRPSDVGTKRNSDPLDHCSREASWSKSLDEPL